METKFEMRALSGQDLYPILSLMGKIGVRDMVTNYFKGQRDVAQKVQKKKSGVGDEDFGDAGMKFFADIIETVFLNIERIKPDVNRILADLCGVKVPEIEALDLNDYSGLLFGFFGKPELAGFIKSIGLFMSK